MELALATLQSDLAEFASALPRLAYALGIFTIMFIIARLVSRGATAVLARRADLGANESFIPQVIKWLILSIGLLLALNVMGLKGIAASMLATGGVVAIVAGFAFREIGENLLAGFFLSFSRPFERGDLIMTGELIGVVSTIELRYVHIRTQDACDVYVPSAQIFGEPLHNFTRDGLRRPSFTIGVAYHDEPENVVRVLEDALRGVDDLLSDPESFVAVNAFGDAFVEYEVFVWIDTQASERSYVAILNDVKFRCWRALREAELTFSTDVSSAIDILSAPEVKVAST